MKEKQFREEIEQKESEIANIKETNETLTEDIERKIKEIENKDVEIGRVMSLNEDF